MAKQKDEGGVADMNHVDELYTKAKEGAFEEHLEMRRRQSKIEFLNTLHTFHQLHEKYYELIMAVESKYPNESRHETALRYIRERESATGVGSDTTMSGVSSA